MSVDEAVAIIKSPENEWTTTPKKVLSYLDYMHRAGLVGATTKDWKDIFFPAIHGAFWGLKISLAGARPSRAFPSRGGNLRRLKKPSGRTT